MIRNLWYAVLESRELKKKPISLMRLGERLLFWRDGKGNPSCLFDRCAHRGASLGKGIICGENHDKVRCPFHGLEYDKTGRCTKIPANGKNTPVPPQFKMKSYPVHEEYGIIWIWWGDNPPENLPKPQFFDDLKDMNYWRTIVDPWDNHYTKVLENQLDVVHLPFIHHNTIGRGNKTLVEGPGLEWKNDTMFFHYVYNKVDDGSTPRTTKEVPVPNPDKEFKIECIMPNIWENYIAKKVRILGLFVPVDETHTLLYLRFYQNFMKVPLLRTFIMFLAAKFNLIVAHQDRRVVNTQIPKKSGIGQGEFLIQGDYPIMQFRKKRVELKKAYEETIKK